MKIVTPKTLCQSYATLYPNEIGLADIISQEYVFGNWLDRYAALPDSAIATQNWGGKVTRALFHALAIKQPRTKKEMLRLLNA